MFYDSDDESNLSSLFTFGILQEDYNIPVPGAENGTKTNRPKGHCYHPNI